jgi:hypothetical protein
MGTWQYRVMRRAEWKGKPHPEWFGIYEVHYDDEGAVTGWTEEEVEPSGDTLEELSRDLEYMRRALEMPVLEWSDDLVGRKDIAGPRSEPSGER